MFFFSSNGDRKKFHESCIINTQETVKHYEQSVKHYELLVEYWKEIFKTSPQSKSTRDSLESQMDMVITQKDELKRQRELLDEMQDLYIQLYGKAATKRLSAKEKRNMAFNKGFMVIQGGLSENSRLQSVINEAG